MLINFWKQILFFNLMMRVEGGDGGGDTDNTADNGGVADRVAGGDGGGDDAPKKPDGLEDSFWDADNGAIRQDALIKSFNDTKAAYTGKEEAIREKVMAEIQGARPEAPEKYDIPEDIGIEAPEGYEIKFADDDPMIKMWRDLSFQGNLSQDQFMEGIRKYVGVQMSQRPDVEAEMKELGENAQDRITRIDNLMAKHLTPEEANDMADFVETAKGVAIMEKLINGLSTSGAAHTGDIPPTDTPLTKDELQEMQRDPRYTGRGRERDNAFIEKVQAGFAKLYPGKAAVGQHR